MSNYNPNDAAQLKHLASLAAKTSTAIGALDDAKVDKVAGKQLSTEDFTTAEKNKLAGITSALQYRGSVSSISNLPANPTVGDVYNIATAGGSDAHGTAIKAGDNVAYNGTGWDVLSGTTDLSGYVEKDGDKVLSTNDFTTAEKTKLAGISTGAQVNALEVIKVDGASLPIAAADKSVNIDLSGKVNKVAGGLSNFVIFGASGAIVDSGIKFASDADVAEMLEEYFPSGGSSSVSG